MYCGLENNYNIKLNELKNCLCGDQLDLKDIFKRIDRLYRYRDIEKYSYLNSLLYPEKARGCKIPSQVPIPSCSFQLRFSYKLNPTTTNNYYLFNPYYLCYEDALGQEYVISDGTQDWTVNNQKAVGDTIWKNVGDIGNMYDWTILASNFKGQRIPRVYSSYRLVSACAKIKYMGTVKQSSGIVGGSILLEDIPYVASQLRVRGGEPLTRAALAPVLNGLTLNDIRNCIYNTENTCLEGLRALYFPVDNSYEEFIPIMGGDDVEWIFYKDTKKFLPSDKPRGTFYSKLDPKKTRMGFNWFFYLINPPRGSFTLEFVGNYECIVNPESLYYMPQPTISEYNEYANKAAAIAYLKNNLFSKLNN